MGESTNSGALVLVVDDEKNVRTVAQLTLEDAGFRVMTAESGEDAVEVFEAHGEAIRVGLLDVTLPKISGTETLILLRKQRPDIPIVLSTGRDVRDAQSQLDASALPNTSFLQKPYRGTKLVQLIREIIES